MKREYNKPETKTILMKGRNSLLQTGSKFGVSAKMSGYTKDTATDEDGWE